MTMHIPNQALDERAVAAAVDREQRRGRGPEVRSAEQGRKWIDGVEPTQDATSDASQSWVHSAIIPARPHFRRLSNRTSPDRHTSAPRV